jgi:hypothetical protein
MDIHFSGVTNFSVLGRDVAASPCQLLTDAALAAFLGTVLAVLAVLTCMTWVRSGASCPEHAFCKWKQAEKENQQDDLGDGREEPWFQHGNSSHFDLRSDVAQGCSELTQ